MLNTHQNFQSVQKNNEIFSSFLNRRPSWLSPPPPLPHPRHPSRDTHLPPRRSAPVPVPAPVRLTPLLPDEPSARAMHSGPASPAPAASARRSTSRSAFGPRPGLSMTSETTVT